jgi:hypothetical protein
MRKLSYFLTGLLIAVSVIPIASAKGDFPVYIRNVDVYTLPADQGITGGITVCSSIYGRAIFDVNVVNETSGVIYTRKLLTAEKGCQTYSLFFNEDFKIASNAGDNLKFSLRNIYEKNTLSAVKRPESYSVFVEDRNPAKEPCGDSKGGDDVYGACVGDFITHTPSGIRMKLISYDRDRADFVLTGVQWGGIVKLRVYKERTKKIVAGNDRLTHLTITNLGKGQDGVLNIMIESN